MNFPVRTSAMSLTLALALGSLSFAQEANWDNWRGPNFNGTATSGKPPINWSSDSHIKWKVTVPGAGSSTPIVHDNQVIVLSAIKTDRVKEGTSNQATPPTESSQGDRPDGRRGGGGRRPAAPTNFHEFVVLSYDRSTGKELWKTVVAENVPHEAGHNTNTFASSSPVTDGKMIYASFGSRGIYCLDMNGKVQWSKQLGTMRTAAGFGEGASAGLAVTS